MADQPEGIGSPKGLEAASERQHATDGGRSRVPRAAYPFALSVPTGAVAVALVRAQHPHLAFDVILVAAFLVLVAVGERLFSKYMDLRCVDNALGQASTHRGKVTLKYAEGVTEANMDFCNTFNAGSPGIDSALSLRPPDAGGDQPAVHTGHPEVERPEDGVQLMDRFNEESTRSDRPQSAKSN